MIYDIIILPNAQDHIKRWKKAGQKKILQKIDRLLDELEEHPRTGTGKPEQLRGDVAGYWSRRIDKKNRLVYSIHDDVVTVEVISAQDTTKTNKPS